MQSDHPAGLQILHRRLALAFFPFPFLAFACRESSRSEAGVLPTTPARSSSGRPSFSRNSACSRSDLSAYREFFKHKYAKHRAVMADQFASSSAFFILALLRMVWIALRPVRLTILGVDRDARLQLTPSPSSGRDRTQVPDGRDVSTLNVHTPLPCMAARTRVMCADSQLTAAQRTRPRAQPTDSTRLPTGDAAHPPRLHAAARSQRRCHGAVGWAVLGVGRCR